MKEIPRLLVADLFSWGQTRSGMEVQTKRGWGATRKNLPVSDPESAASLTVLYQSLVVKNCSPHTFSSLISLKLEGIRVKMSVMCQRQTRMLYTGKGGG